MNDYWVDIHWNPTDKYHVRRWHWYVYLGHDAYPTTAEGWCWTPKGADRAARRVVNGHILAAMRHRIRTRVYRGDGQAVHG